MRMTKGLAVAVCALLLCRLRCIVAAERGRLRRPGPQALNVSWLVNASGEEQGLLSMAFAPDYAHSGRF
jgi:hypothetical protein